MTEQFAPRPGRLTRHRRRLAVVIAAGVLVVVAVPFAAWEAWWPTNVDARALDAFGPPIAGATRIGPDWVSSGNAVCLDSCSVLTRSFTVPPTIRVGRALDEAGRAAHRAGYETPFAVTCTVSNPAASRFRCSLDGQTPTSSVDIEVYGIDPAVVTPSSGSGDGLHATPKETPVTEIRVGISER